MKQIAATICIALMALQLSAQADSTVKKGRNYGKTIFLSAGYSNINTSPMHGLLPSSDLSVGHNFYVLGAGFNVQLKGLMLGLSAEWMQRPNFFANLLDPDMDEDSISIDARNFSGMINIGYAIVDRPKVKLYPTIGVGWCRMELNITQNQDVAAGTLTGGTLSGNEFNFFKHSAIFDFGLGFDYIFGQPKENKDIKGVMLGVKAGYQFVPPHDEWQHQGGEVIGGPNYGASNAYIKLVLGIGSFSKSKMKFNQRCSKTSSNGNTDNP